MTTPSAAEPWREPWLRALLRCPLDHAELADATVPSASASARPDADSPDADSPDADSPDAGAPALACTDPAHRVLFPVRDGVPVLLLDDAVPVAALQDGPR